MQQNFDTLLQTIRHYKLFSPDSTVLIAVSGGADSLALLHWMVNHREQLQIKLHVATLNHNLRPEATDDVLFVQQISASLSVPCTAGFADVPALATQNGTGIEATARKARYDFLAKIASATGSQQIVTGHHADDQSETILMHMLRGSGTNGLVGMRLHGQLPYHPHYALIRPLLHISRTTIEAYCEAHNLHPRVDESNNDTHYFRNEIRHEILPRLRQINPQLDVAFARLASIADVEQDFIVKTYQENFKPLAHFGDRVSLSLPEFEQWHPAIQRQFMLDALAHLNVEASFDHINHAIRLALKGQVGGLAEFRGDARLRVGYGTLYIEPPSLALPAGDYVQIDKSYDVHIPGRTILGKHSLVTARQPILNYDACLSVPDDTSISLRTRRPGDRFNPQGMGGHSQKIKNWMIDNKIPIFVRDGLPLVIIGNVIAGIILPWGWRIAESFVKNENPQRNVYFKVVVS